MAGNSEVKKFRKPNKISFEIMHIRFGIPYSKMVYVGDNKRKDFEAPKQLGMGYIYFKNKDGLYYCKDSSES